MSDSDTRAGFQVLFAVSPKILTNRTPAPESDTDTRTRVHVTLDGRIQPNTLFCQLHQESGSGCINMYLLTLRLGGYFI